MMHILEEHDTVRSALDYLSSVPRMGRNNLILADAGGDLAVVELGYHHLAIVKARNGIVVNTNHFVSPRLKESFVDCNPPPVKGNSFHRYELVRRELEAARGNIDVAFAQRLMAIHAGPLASICRHLELGGQSATIATAIYQPARRTLRFCHGYPCQSPYHTIILDNGQGSFSFMGREGERDEADRSDGPGPGCRRGSGRFDRDRVSSHQDPHHWWVSAGK
jgi:hypothetical protein